MKNLLLIPDYLKKSFEKNFDEKETNNFKICFYSDKNLLKKIFKSGKSVNYKTCFYPKGDNAIYKIMGAYNVYEPDKIIVIGSNQDRFWKKAFSRKDFCPFDLEVVHPITLDDYEVTFKKFRKKNLDLFFSLV